MISVWVVVVILFGHWLADFVLQPHWMGTGKSKDWWVLSQHAFRITGGGVMVAVALGFFFPISATGALIWALVNGVAHFAIDAVTSRMTGKLFAKQDFHNFFVVIGFDQFLHVALAVVTFALFVI